MKRLLIFTLALAPMLLTTLPVTQVSAVRPARRAHDYAPGEVIVKLKEGLTDPAFSHSQDQLMAVARSMGEAESGLATLSVEPIAGRLPGGRLSEIISRRGIDRTFVLRFDPASDVEAVVSSLRRNPAVEYAEPNYRIETGAFIPNDPRFNLQWSLRNLGLGVDGQPSFLDADIKATDAWEVTTGSPDVIIAISDTGIDLTHPDLEASIYTNPGEVPGNGVDDDGNGYIDDVHGFNVADQNADISDVTGHGTQMAGIIAAGLDNGIGISGVSRAKVLAAKFFKKTGDHPLDFDATIADAARSLVYSIAAGAHIINASWRTMLAGRISESEVLALRDAVAATNDAGVLLVCIAGNDGFNNDYNKVYPGAYKLPNQLVVGATDYADDMWHPTGDFFTVKTGFGPESVHLAAPGVFVFTTLARGDCLGCSTSNDPEDWYGAIDGTSASAAFVSGVAALVKSKYPDDHVWAVRRRILEGVDKLDKLRAFFISGGRLNALGALTVEPNFSRPAITSGKFKNGNGKLTLKGRDFIKGAWVIVGRTAYEGKVKGAALKKIVVVVPAGAFPPGTPVEVRVVNPDGGSSEPFTITR